MLNGEEQVQELSQHFFFQFRKLIAVHDQSTYDFLNKKTTSKQDLFHSSFS